MPSSLSSLWSWFVQLSTACLPNAAPAMRFRGWLYGFAMRERGRDFQVGSGVTLVGLHRISVGDHVYLAPGAVLIASSSITLDDEVLIAYHAVLSDADHVSSKGSYRYGPIREGHVVIGRGAWIGANATVLRGVTIGAGTVVGAGSVVTRSLPDHCRAGGVPARVLSEAAADVSA